jgi:hypothetical protein
MMSDSAAVAEVVKHRVISKAINVAPFREVDLAPTDVLSGAEGPKLLYPKC